MIFPIWYRGATKGTDHTASEINVYLNFGLWIWVSILLSYVSTSQKPCHPNQYAAHTKIYTHACYFAVISCGICWLFYKSYFSSCFTGTGVNFVFNTCSGRDRTCYGQTILFYILERKYVKRTLCFLMRNAINGARRVYELSLVALI